MNVHVGCPWALAVRDSTCMTDFKQCYNRYRVHSSLYGYTPAETSGESLTALICIILIGKRIVVECFRHQWPPDEQFAIDSLL